MRYGGIDCSFPEKDLKNIDSLFDKQYMNFYSDEEYMTDREIESLKRIISKHCKVRRDGKISKVVTIHSDTSIDDSFSEFHSMTQARDKMVEQSKKAAQKKNKDQLSKDTIEDDAEDVEEEPIEQYKSIMFSEQDSQLILDAIQHFNKAVQRNNNNNNISTIEVKGFYLNSILYLTDAKWIVWLNNRKIGSDTKHPFISVEEVTPEYVKVRWTTNDLNAISPNWKNILSYTGKNTYKSKEFDITITNLSKKKISIVTFKIKPNQTFDPAKSDDGGRKDKLTPPPLFIV